MTQRRLLILTPDYAPAPGGIQRILGEIAARIADRWDVTVIAPRVNGAGAVDLASPVRVRRSLTPWGGPRSAVVLADMALRGAAMRPDAVLAGHAAVLPAALAAAHGAPVVVLLYGGELWAPRTAAVMRRLAPRATRFIAISRFTAGVAAEVGAPPERIVLAAPGADAPAAPPDLAPVLAPLGLVRDDGTIRPFLVTLGRLAEPHKCHDMLLRVLPALTARHPELRYVIAGEGPLRGHLEHLARTSGADRSVHFAGHVDQHGPLKGALLAVCRAHVMISRETRAATQFEGFGIAFVEAAFAGRPSLAGNSGGIPDAVVDGVTGILVDPHDPVAIAAGASRLLDDPAYADALGAAARERAQAELTWEHATERYERVLDEVAP